jgi:O-antigen/teichoic acid export membrane protein
VSVVLVGLAMFSDVGIGPAISQSPRGDDRNFLNTAWTINVCRGLILWAATAILAYPAALLYGADELIWLLPVAGATLFIAGFNPTRIDTANRHLLLGKVTVLDLASQVVGIVAMVSLAWAMQSVWALVLGAIIGALVKLGLCWFLLPGESNRLQWEPEAGRSLISFGKWIFFSTACGFALSQGDKAILGAYLPLEGLGIYNIGYFLASFPVLLAGAVTGRVMIPLYRDHPPAASDSNRQKLQRLRYGLSGGVLLLLFAMAMAGPWLVDILYDERYASAGIIVVAISIAQMPMVIGMTYDQAALAAGDGRGYFHVILGKAIILTFLFFVGAHYAGLAGALLGQCLGQILSHALVIAIAREHQVWDGKHDLYFGVLAFILVFIAFASHKTALFSLS